MKELSKDAQVVIATCFSMCEHQELSVRRPEVISDRMLAALAELEKLRYIKQKPQIVSHFKCWISTAKLSLEDAKKLKSQRISEHSDLVIIDEQKCVT